MLPNDTFLQQDVCVLRAFACRDNAVRFFRALVVGKAVDCLDFRVRLISRQRRAVFVPNHGFYWVARHNRHQHKIAFIILIQREQRQNRAQQFRRADAIRTNDALPHAFCGEIRVRQHNLVPMPHLAQHFQQFRRNQRGNAL